MQSVLDVKDDNPSPKGVAPLFNRSILILTPQRALKFTAISAERHYVWLTALSFLAHSSQAIPEITTQPAPKLAPVPDFHEPPPPSKARRPGIRDSIRITKSRGNFARPPSVPPPIPSAPSSSIGEVSVSTQRTQRTPEPFPPLPASHHRRDSSYSIAEAPHVPRFQDRGFQEKGGQERANNGILHGRKRSNTGGHIPPPLSFRGFSGPAGASGLSHTTTNSVAGASVGTAGSSDIYQSQPSSYATWALSTTASQRTSEASSRPSNFFDAIGTMRMEAFITPLSYPRLDDHPDEQDEFRNLARRRSKELRRRSSRHRNRDSYNSRTTRTTDDWSRTDDDFFAREDPFRGF
ncbi:hypothetical protein IMZ48_05405 [Candidatus Bathyarchaeota archaeon]|nr:hypothetical protein [Candidatus Bathyarchaeota archaeon]